MEYSDDNINNDFYDASTIAWKLFQDETNTPLSACILPFGPDGETDLVTYNFEVLLSIFMELLMHIMMIEIAKDVENEIEEEIKTNEYNIDPDNIDLEPYYDDFNMKNYLETIIIKFKRIGHIVNVQSFDIIDDEYEKQFLELIIKDRYCRIILKNNPTDMHYFKSIGSNEQFDFIPSSNYKKNNKLRDVYAILMLNDKLYKIYFDKICVSNSNIVKNY